MKVYVQVYTTTKTDGRMIPRALVWEDGMKYRIDKVMDYKPSNTMKGSRLGDRYTIVIDGQQSYLYFERNHSNSGNNIGRWYVERKCA